MFSERSLKFPFEMPFMKKQMTEIEYEKVLENLANRREYINAEPNSAQNRQVSGK